MSRTVQGRGIKAYEKTGSGALQLLPPRPTNLLVQPAGAAATNGALGWPQPGSALMPFTPDARIFAGLGTWARNRALT